MSTPVNNGLKIYTLLVEYSTLTGIPTGRTKPNVPSDPDYIDPVEDLTTCPIDGELSTMDILVDMETGFTATIKLNYGMAQLTRSTSGTWTVPTRTYDSIIFNVTVSPTTKYIVRVTYNSGLVKELIVTNIGGIFVNGPFPAITKLEILSTDLGDYNNDYGSDFF
jgi:hypothetical protein